MKILLVEDSATLRFAMRNYIIEAGHTALLARTGEEALQLLETTPVDMIIMDVEMPGLDGFETTRLIREWLCGHWIPIIFVTGRSEDESYREGIDAGGDDYLIKPVSAIIIKAKIRAMERIAEMRDQLNQLNAELETISQLDSLTQIYNRRTFNELAMQQWLLAARQQKPVSLLMIDVDHFKLFNDNYGHPEGDNCLKKITNCIASCLRRPFDILGRYGGEEFIVLLPETNAKGAAKVAQDIHINLKELMIPHKAAPHLEQVTLSIGGVSCTNTLTYSFEDLIKRADRALYKAKHSGRNCTLLDDIAIHKTILVVKRNSQLTQELLASLSHQFNTVLTDSSEEALDISLDIRPDIILMDSTIADKDDEYLCRALAHHEKTKDIPIMLITSENSLQRPISDSTIGIRGYIERPIDRKELLQKLEAFS